MDCATLCLISAAVAFTPSPDIQKCTYCLDVRGITDTCNHDLIECAKNYPDMVLYCLTVSSIHFDGQVSRALRCRSHTAYNVSLAWTEEVMGLEECSFLNAKVCDCSTCPFRGETSAKEIKQHLTYRHRHSNSNSSANSKYFDKDVLYSNGLPHTPLNNRNNNNTYLLSKGMAENIRGGWFDVISDASSKPMLFFSFYYFFIIFVFGFIISQ